MSGLLKSMPLNRLAISQESRSVPVRAQTSDEAEQEHLRATESCGQSQGVPVGDANPDIRVIETGTEVGRQHTIDRNIETVERDRQTGQGRLRQFPDARIDR